MTIAAVHPYAPRPGDTWCRDCNSAPGETPHENVVLCAGGCGDALEVEGDAFTFEPAENAPGFYCETCYLTKRETAPAEGAKP